MSICFIGIQGLIVLLIIICFIGIQVTNMRGMFYKVVNFNQKINSCIKYE